MEEQWVPLFATTYFELGEVQTTWIAVVKSKDDQDRLEFLVRTGPALQRQMNEKRLALIRPLDELERTIERKIREEYARARLVNNTITGFLMSASEVTEVRKKYLEMAGISDGKVNEVIDQVNDTVANLLEKGVKVEQLAEKSDKYIDKIKAIKNSL
jgi:hypothetical protein